MSVVGGERIIDRVRIAMREVATDIVIIANDPELFELLGETRERVRSDARAERGSLVGLHSALAAAAGQDVVVVAWDMPFVNAPILRFLVSRMSAGIDAVIPESARGLEPFCAIYGSRCLPLAERALDAGELRMSSFIDSLPVVRQVGRPEIERLGDPERFFFNVNTPADLARAEAMARGE